MDREEAYRIYVSDALYYLPRRKAMAHRLADIISGSVATEPAETGEETIARIMRKCNGGDDIGSV